MIKQKDGTEKPTKVPYNARTGRKADPTDPKNWSRFEQVLSVLEADRSYAGPGFAISPGFMFVDYDKCRDPQTGVIDKSVAAKVAFLDSYTEISPSGTGLHVLCRSDAPLPAGRRKLNHVEMYDGKRFATMTGDHLEGTPVTVENRTEELLSAYNEHFGQCDSKSNSAAEQKRAAVVVPITSTSTSDEAILTDCRAAKNAAKFSRLFDDGAIRQSTVGIIPTPMVHCARFSPIELGIKSRSTACSGNRRSSAPNGTSSAVPGLMVRSPLIRLLASRRRFLRILA
jgi:putative DNA primase/helicase